MLQIILSVLSSTGIISIILHEILVKRKQRKKQDKKMNAFMECFEIYVDNNGGDPKVKKIIKKKMKEVK